MSRRSYHAFIKAARKDGGLSLPAARKVYRKVSARLGEPAKAVDIKRHSRIFRESLTKRDRAKRAILQRESKQRRRRVVARAAATKARAAERKSKAEFLVIEKIESFRDWQRMQLQGPIFEDEEIEYASTAEY